MTDPLHDDPANWTRGPLKLYFARDDRRLVVPKYHPAFGLDVQLRPSRRAAAVRRDPVRAGGDRPLPLGPRGAHIGAMPALGSWLQPHPEGIYVAPGDFWIDPSTPKPAALVTHGHADHARGGHGKVLATAATLAIMGVRYGEQNGMAADYGEAVRIGDVTATFVPAGHVLRARRRSSSTTPASASSCRAITSAAPIRPARRSNPCRATSSSPRRPSACRSSATPIPAPRSPRSRPRSTENPDRCVLVGAYALGKAQRVIAELRGRSATMRRSSSTARSSGCATSTSSPHGVDLGRPASGHGIELRRRPQRARVVVAPPSALNDRWSRRLPDPITAMATARLDARPPARGPADGGAAADRLRPRRLGRVA